MQAEYTKLLVKWFKEIVFAAKPAEAAPAGGRSDERPGGDCTRRCLSLVLVARRRVANAALLYRRRGARRRVVLRLGRFGRFIRCLSYV